jgi:hypothetical protein
MATIRDSSDLYSILAPNGQGDISATDLQDMVASAYNRIDDADLVVDSLTTATITPPEGSLSVPGLLTPRVLLVQAEHRHHGALAGGPYRGGDWRPL